MQDFLNHKTYTVELVSMYGARRRIRSFARDIVAAIGNVRAEANLQEFITGAKDELNRPLPVYESRDRWWERPSDEAGAE